MSISAPGSEETTAGCELHPLAGPRLGISRDLTRHSSFRRLLEADPDPCFLIAAGNVPVVEDSNPAGQALLSLSSAAATDWLAALADGLVQAQAAAAEHGNASFTIDAAADGSVPAYNAQVHLAGDASHYLLRLVAPERLASLARPFSDIFSSNPALALLVEPESGRIVDLSRSLADLLGASSADLRRRRFQEFVVEPEPIFAAALAAAAEGYRREFELTLHIGQGEQRIMHVHAGPVRAAGQRQLFCTLLDITESRQTELQLKEEEERYRAFISNSSEGIWRFRLDEPVPTSLPIDEQVRLFHERAYLAECNTAMARMYGCSSPGDLIGARLTDLLPLEDLRNKEHLYRLMSSGYRLVQEESHELAADGTQRIFLNSVTCIVEGGALTGAWGTQIDVTDQRRAEQALRESESRLQELVTTMYEGLLVIDEERHCLFANPSAGRILGRDAEAVTGLTLTDLVAPGQDAVLESQRSIRLRGLPSTYELDFLRPDGERRTVMVHSTPRPFMAGEFRGAYLILHDVTDSRRMERELAQSQIRLSSLLDQLKDVVVYETGPGLRYVSTNLGTILGYSPAELEAFSQDFAVLSHPDDHASYVEAEAAWRAAGAPGVLVMELRWRHRDGHWVWLEDRMLLTEDADGGITRRGVMIDISERKRIEQAAEESEVRYRELMERTSDAVVRTGPDGVIIYSNPVARKLLGLHPGADILEAARRLAGKNKISSLLGNAIALSRSRTPTWSFQLEMTDSSGERRFFDWTCVFFYGSSGETLRTDFIGRDLTRQRMLMRQMLERQKDESIAALAGGIAHDFNNILTSILGAASLLEDGASSASARELVQSITAGAQQMAGLTSRLLAYSKTSAREPAVISVPLGVRDTLQMLRPVIGVEPRLQLDLGEEPLHVHADPTEFNQVILNLVLNAHEAVADDSGRITVRTRAVSREDWECTLHGTHAAGPYVLVEVSDNGDGIDPGLLSRVFEPYFSTKVRGRGLGLAAVAGIVASCGGCIEVRSEPGCGATFSVLLPRVEVAQKPVQPARQASRPVCSGRILLVEDEETVRFVASRVLQRAGYQVEAAVDGLEGLALLEAAPGSFDLILADAKMPRLGGIELAAQLEAAGSRIPLVLCTGYAPAIHLHEAADAGPLSLPGVSRLLQKPYSGDELLEVVADFIQSEAVAHGN